MAVRVSILIPVFNQLEYTRHCVAAIYLRTPEEFELIIVDNGSTDGTQEFLAELQQTHANVRVITNQKNLGFSPANNQAAEIARGEFLLLLNNDTLVEPGWLAGLLAVFEREPRAGIVGPKLLFPDTGLINHAGYVYNKKLECFYPIYQSFDGEHPVVNRSREYQALLGACMLIPRDLYFEVGCLENIGLEDVDLCLKVRAAGRKVIYEPSSVVFHFGSVTIKNSPGEALPMLTSDEFEARWPAEARRGDDLEIYRQDGFQLEFTAERSFRVRDAVVPALEAYTAGEAAAAAGDTLGAVELFERAVRLYAGNRAAYVGLVAGLVELGQTERALNFADELLVVEPDYKEFKQIAARLREAISANSGDEI